ncbi:methyltransferase domain-containing protein [Eubacterium multiforme]|uniref:2-polyprenyl-3-methyl-5-hydroxy-6-metoxy-1, 4-benzoquinol methylase n=1 Tax=Eubacterium multiforme TaxID=83339 RepID=A0ABT9UXI0_9FIRM|nr:methyltransferase domain-containing protein [Eubacterium multiforme]MDQ0151018.1 2-polyprenyl-3-methyl-5-hydroxy-6-metoxy-1,4-benzoquinol methylase [Eubacterium multiforme]
MHYKIKKQIIRSEYAAKSVKQPNKEIIKIINGLPKDMIVLDYGCGKLRYTLHLSNKVKYVYSIDSVEQINRVQLINGERTTIKEYVNNFKNINAFSINENKWKKARYDFILCTNVLSAIPIYSERIKIFENIKKFLKDDGVALVSTQYNNSYFSNYSFRKDCNRHYDGWIIKSKSNIAFYGLIDLEKLKYYAKKVGLKIDKAYKKSGSAYLFIRK